MRKAPSKLLVLLIILAFSASIFTTGILASNSEDTATMSIERAENALVSAYQAVLEAERVGANTAALLARMNDAAELLAKAQVAFRLGDFDEAVSSADLCYEIGENVKSEADELQFKAYGLKVMDSWLTMTGSVVGVVAVGFGSFWGWRVFKRRYVRRVLKMKPEVAKDES
jgi:hypothetical protein